jgi:hypothetical protein
MHRSGFHFINTAAASYVPRRPFSPDATFNWRWPTPQENNANPGYTATDLNRHSGFRSVAEGAEASVHLATLDADGPGGILWGHLWTAGGPSDAYGPLPLVSDSRVRRGL